MKINTLTPSLSACCIMLFVAGVSYAEADVSGAIQDQDSQELEEIQTTDSGETDSGETDSGKTDSGESAETESAGDAAPAGELSAGKELSVPPSSHVTYPKDRPSWVDDQRDLDSSVHTWVVTTGNCKSTEECVAKLEALQHATVMEYVEETTGWVCDDDLISNEWIEQELISRRYEGTVQQGGQELQEMAVELRFDSSFREMIRQAKNSVVVLNRLQATGGLLALGLLGLCCTGGLLGVISRRFA